MNQGHGVAGLLGIDSNAHHKLLADRQLTAFSNNEETAIDLSELVPFLLADQLIENSAAYNYGENFAPRVVVDGPLVAGHSPASS